MKARIGIALCLSITLFTACGTLPPPKTGTTGNAQTSAQAAAPTSTPSIQLTIQGSSDGLACVTDLAKAYSAAHTDVRITVQGSSNEDGIQAVLAGTASAAMSSRLLSDEEKAKGLTETVLGHETVAIIINPVNPLSGLTKDELAGIFTQMTSDWGDVGGTAGEISVHVLDKSAAARQNLESGLGTLETDGAINTSGIADDTVTIEADAAAMVKAVAANPAAIGFIPLDAALPDGVKALQVDGATPVQTDGAYPIVRPLALVSPVQAVTGWTDFVKYCQEEPARAVILAHGLK